MISRCPQCGEATELGSFGQFIHMDDETPECQDIGDRETKDDQ